VISYFNNRMNLEMSIYDSYFISLMEDAIEVSSALGAQDRYDSLSQYQKATTSATHTVVDRLVALKQESEEL